MNGDALAERVRGILRDKESSIKKGEFWTDYEIRLALNITQSIFINYCIKAKHFFLLSGLFTYKENTISSDNPLPLPSDYLYYGSGAVYQGIGQINEMAQIHIGGDADKYLWTRHNSISIINNRLYFIKDGVYSNGIFYYYKKPSFIGLTFLGDDTRQDFNTIDFDEFVYNDILVNHSSMILAIKEIQTPREYKKLKRTINNLSIYPMHIENYVEVIDVPETRVTNDSVGNGQSNQNVNR